MLAPCKYCGEWAMRPTHSPWNCPDRAFYIIGEAVEAAMKADPSKTTEEIVEMAQVWAETESNR